MVIVINKQNRTFKCIDFPAVIRYIENDRIFPAPANRARRVPAGEAIPIKDDILAVYTRCYSEILPFQRAGRAEYALLGQSAGPLRLIVRAQHTGEEKARAAQCELRDMDEETARCLVQFLYENAVSVENVCDVLQDIFSAARAEGER